MDRESAVLSLLLLALLCLVLSCPVAAQDSAVGDLTMSLYFSPTCPHCHPVRALIKRILAKHPQMRSLEFNLAEPCNVEKMAAAYQQYGVPEERWGGTIAAFVGDRWWNDGDKILKELAPAVDTLISNPRPAPPMAATAEASPAVISSPQQGEALKRIFSRFGVAAVAAAGLLDGINPCALATLVFLISYLTYSKRGSREILATGAFFAAGVFAAYLAIGLGLFRVLQMTSGISLVSRLLYPVMALGTLTLSGYSTRDYLLARQGHYRDMTLQLPASIKRMSHSAVRQLGKPGVFVGFAFVIGAAVSVLELFCTGQIYLPTLMYMWSTSTQQARVLSLLVLYVFMFTVPVLVLTGLAYFGVQSKAMGQLTQAHVPSVKLATAVFFLLLTGFLVTVSLGKL